MIDTVSPRRPKTLEPPAINLKLPSDMPPKTLATYVFSLWFAISVGGAVVPRVFDATGVAGLVLIGLTLLAYEKDQRYPGMGWPEAVRTFRGAHTWSMWTVLFVLFFSWAVMAGRDQQDPRNGIMLLLAVYYLLQFATPRAIESHVDDAPHADRSDNARG